MANLTAQPWLPSLDLHEEDGELVLHAELPHPFDEGAELALDGSDLVVRSDGGARGRLPLPFPPQAMRAAALPAGGGFEVRVADADRQLDLLVRSSLRAAAAHIRRGHAGPWRQCAHPLCVDAQNLIPPLPSARIDWQGAKDAAIALWEGLRERAATMEEEELLVEVNAAFSLCDAAREEMRACGVGLNCCRYCAFYEQFGGCRGISLRMTLRIVEGDTEGLRRLIDEFLRDLRALAVPAAA
ncbi:MAG TPA: hypothetical protein VF121_12855 [Thermoanaerobaculia bacterium]|nr:hypothetical protein [Thermoanaerobaculia bacterium]